MSRGKAIIIGAGPAGLTAAFELVTRTGIKPIVLEKDDCVGGISKTVNYRGNRIDIGGHRFFSKSDRVMEWWLARLPLQALPEGHASLTYQNARREIQGSRTAAPHADTTDGVMLLRARKSRIYFLRRFFEYPLRLSRATLAKLGALRTLRIGVSYVWASAFPIRDEKTLEHFFINRFGRELYSTFFQSYTEKVWGVPCSRISAEWGAQRIKGLSVWKTLLHAVKTVFKRDARTDLAQKTTETSLIEQFLYPKFGPGQMWDTVAGAVCDSGGEICKGYQVDHIETTNGRIRAIHATEASTGNRVRLEGDYFFSTMPVRDLIRAMTPGPPAHVREVSEGLVYRDFITVGLLLRKLKVSETGEHAGKLIRDNWIYIQEPDVRVGRLQIFNNWSPWMVADPEQVWIGLEYFCNEGDELWRLPDVDMIELARRELASIEIIDDADVLDSTVIRIEKTYPAYFGTYDRFQEIRDYVDGFENLFLIGRNGMHRYNNQDHSMLTAMTAVDNIIAGNAADKRSLWDINTEQDYHEENASASHKPAGAGQPALTVNRSGPALPASAGGAKLRTPEKLHT
jgi:protoporphyrinogen oxidase